MDYIDYLEMDHVSYRHDSHYLDQLENPNGNRCRSSRTWTKEEMIEWNRRRCLAAMPNLDEESKNQKAKVVRYRGEGGGFKIRGKDGSLSMESYATRKGAQAMVDGTFGSAGGIR